MRAVIQRVSKASCKVNNNITGEIESGLVVFLGIEEGDDSNDISWLAKKITHLRIFDDEQGLMNKSLIDIEGNILLISQFTLLAATKKGNRPSFIRATKPERAIPIYEAMIAESEKILNRKIATGMFGADMKIELINDGPVTIMMDTNNKDNY